MSTEANKALIRRYIDELWNQGNLDVADEIIALAYTDHAPPGLSGPEGEKQHVSMALGPFPDLQLILEDLIAEGDKVAARMLLRGTQQGEWGGVAPSGKPVLVASFDIFRIAHGQIVEHWAEVDHLGLLQQLGVITLPGSSE